VFALTTFVENRFQEKKKSGAVFLDLSSAYDTAWKKGLLLKLARIIKCKTTLTLMERLLSDRKFEVSLNRDVSQKKSLRNGLPQSSVISPILFNVYTADIPKTTSRKFNFADDVSLVAQGKSFEELEK